MKEYHQSIPSKSKYFAFSLKIQYLKDFSYVNIFLIKLQLLSTQKINQIEFTLNYKIRKIYILTFSELCNIKY